MLMENYMEKIRIGKHYIYIWVNILKLIIWSKISKLREKYFKNSYKSNSNNDSKSPPPDNIGGLVSIETDFPVIDEDIPDYVDRKGRLSGYEGFDGNFNNCKGWKRRWKLSN